MYQPNTFDRAPRSLTGSTAPDTYTRTTSGRRNGGRSLRPEHLELHRSETATYHATVYGDRGNGALLPIFGAAGVLVVLQVYVAPFLELLAS